MKLVNAVHDYPDHPRKGASQPLFVRCDDGIDYVVKFPVQGWTKALPNEVIGSGLVQQLNLTTPSPAIINVSPELVGVSSVLQRRNVTPGQYFGTERLANALDLSDAVGQKLRPSMLINRDEAGGLVAFDNWVKNGDRNDGNVLLEGVRGAVPARFKMYAIDHGLILTGQAWTPETLKAATTDHALVPCHPFIMSCVWDPTEFDRVGSAIAGMPEDAVRSNFFPVPSAWGIGDDDREAAVAFLMTRRAILAEVLGSFRFAPDRGSGP